MFQFFYNYNTNNLFTDATASVAMDDISPSVLLSPLLATVQAENKLCYRLIRRTHPYFIVPILPLVHRLSNGLYESPPYPTLYTGSKFWIGLSSWRACS